ncbi:MAG: transglycosylase domain-containing protein, partial [Atopobiaceae bacterium]|nr:transglycosylase domain-containing protein [Atopobiaceae bacterium]
MGIRSRRARSHSKTHVVGFTIAGFFGFIAMLAVAGALSLSSIVAGWLEALPDYSSAEAYLVAVPTRIYDCECTQIAEYYLQQRRSIDLSPVSRYVIDGTVDTEDVRFYTHNGVDPQGILRAVWAQLMGRSEGASTITQQLVRNTVLSSEQFEYSVKRKVREAYIALQMEKMFTKDQILNMYLNTIYYGHGAYGIEAAAVTYFNVHASDLTLSQAALLVGLPQSPSVYDPTINPDLAISRRNIVLDRMLYAGDITQEEFDAASSEELVLNIGSLGYPVGTFPYFTDYVRELLLEDFDEATILQGGLKVYTTIDPDIQRAAERAVVNQLDESWNDSLTGALVCIENGNGYVRAMVGGRSYDNNEFNAATAATRQCGSSFKVYTLVAALRSGMNPNVNLNCTSPMQITPTWKVQNYGNSNYGNQTLESATVLSSNTAYAQVAEAIGAEKIVETCRLMGIDVDIPAYLSISIGSVGVPPLQMAEGFSVLATGGYHRDPCCITRIEDRNGNVVYEHTDNPEKVLEDGVAEAATDILKGVVAGNATGYEVGAMWYANAPIAGKTGTSDEATDLWLVGYTPQYTTAVWCGVLESRETVYSQGYNAHTADLPQPIFSNFMNSVLEGVDWQDCPDSGIRPNYLPNSMWKFVGTSAAMNDEELAKKEAEEAAKRAAE